ncbi:MAG: 4Fe-4S binding protein, partial [Desulfofustis sp.]
QREGILIIEMAGTKSNITDSLAYLEKLGVVIERLATRIRRDDERCFQCGACTGVCPVGALYIRRPDMAVMFDAEKCTGCSQCVLICPDRAMEMSIGKEWMETDTSSVEPLIS